MADPVLEARLERHKQKIRLLEDLIETKTRELYLANQELEQRVAERTRDLQAALAAAEEASRAKQAFVAHVSHELRTPLHAIRGMAEALTPRLADPDSRSMIRTLTSSGDHMLRLVNQLLDLSWLGRDEMPLDEEPADLATMAQDVVSALAATAAPKGIEVRGSVSGAWLLVHVDPTRMREILLNFGGNAVKFTHRGSVEIRGEASEEGGLVVVRWTVADTGCGMDPATVARVFEPFFQSRDTYRREHGGAGLGMAISRRLVQAMGGEVEVESAVGTGTCVRFTTRHRRAEAVVARSATPAPLPALRVLVVDDQPANCQVAEAILGMLGCVAVSTRDPAHGLELAEAERFDLWLVDYHMPRLDGVEWIRRRRAAGDRTPAFLVTADLTSSARVAAADAGADLLVPKPYGAAELRQAIASIGASPAPPPPEASPTEPEVRWFDLEGALARMGGQIPTLRAVSEAFLESLPELLADLDAPGDPKAPAHALKGSAATVGASRLAEIAYRVEKGDHAPLRSGELARAAEETRRRMGAWVRG
jgi:signal transduction histidine kinase/HPt (histidine-containing phosphotransfer) domain-containing protein